jgi:DNA-binding PadR family transcriptional regulator
MHHHLRKVFGLFGDELGSSGGRFFAPGEIRLGLLSLLAEKPSHGYELMVRLEERCGGIYKASAGAIYPTLQQLEDQGLACWMSMDNKKVFELTADGHEVVQKNVEAIAKIWKRADAWQEWSDMRHPQAAEIIAPLLRLVKAAVKVAVKAHGDPVIVNRIRATLEAAQEEIERMRWEK